VSEAWTSTELATLDRVYAGATWRGIRQALPGRTPQAIGQKAHQRDIVRRIAAKPRWTPPQLKLLARLYPTASWARLLEVFAPHTRQAIARQAYLLHLGRPRQGRQSRHPIIRALRARRLKQNVTQKDLARRIGIHPKNLCNWERGQFVPEFRLLLDWVQALDASLVLA
jgi:DNA-binding XRE family transcriptional regulator